MFVKDHLLVPILQNGKVVVCVVGLQLDGLINGGKVAVEVVGHQVVPLLKLVLLPAATVFTGDRRRSRGSSSSRNIYKQHKPDRVSICVGVPLFPVPFFNILLVFPFSIAVLFKF